MPCPKCNGHDLWDDLMWWGCNHCGWTGTALNRANKLDRFGPMTFDAKGKTQTEIDELQGCHCQKPHHLPAWYCPVHGDVVVPMD